MSACKPRALSTSQPAALPYLNPSTPRPDITTGIRCAVLVQKLQALDLDGAAAEAFLETLQQAVDRNGQYEPATFFRARPTTTEHSIPVLGPHTTNHHPLVFSIGTQGPYHELWAHFTTMEKGVRMLNMSILKTWHASFRDEALRLLTAVDNVIG